ATNTKAVLANTQIDLTDGSADGAFYGSADNTCAGAPIANFTLTNGSSTATVYFKDDKAESLTLTAADNATVLTSGTLNVQIGPDRIDLSGPASVKADTCSAAFTVTTRDAQGTAANVVANTQVNLADGSATGTFHTSNDCSDGAKTSITINSGSNTGTFYFKDTTGAALTITASDNAAGGLSSDTSNITVGPDRLLISGSQSPAAGTCTLYTVYSRDAATNNTNVLANTQVNLDDGGAAGTLYAAGDNTCVGAAITDITITAGQSSAQFRYKNNTSESVTLTADDPAAAGLTTATLTLSVGPDRIDLAGTSPIKAGVCTAYTVTTKDVGGNAANVLVNTQINLTDGSATGAFYGSADNTCAGAAINNVTINTGSNSATFYFKDNVAAQLTLTAADNAAGGLTQDTLTLDIGPDRFDLAGPASVKAGVCSGVFTVTAKDAAGNTANVLANTQVNLADGSATGTFHTANDCSDGAKTFITIANGANNGTFYFKDTVAAQRTIGVTDNAAGGLTSDSATIDVGPDRLYIAGTTPIKAGVCTQLTINTRDAATNNANPLAAVTVDLTDGSATGAFYGSADNTCAGAAITQTSIATNANSATVYFKDDVGAALTLTAADNAGNLTSGTFNITLGPDRLAVTGPSSVMSNVCSAVFTVTAKDAAGNTKNVLANTQVDLTDGSATGTFHTANDCSDGAKTFITITSGSSSGTFYFKDTVAAQRTIAVADNAADLAGSNMTVDVGPDRLVITGSQTPPTGTCQLYTVTAKDSATNTANVLVNTQVNLDDGGAAGTLYAAADNTCVGAAITDITITAGQSSGQFRYKNNTAENVTLTADDPAAGGLTSGTLSLTTGPDRIDLTGTTPINSGVCQQFTVTTKDVGGNATNVLAITQINLDDGGAAGNFYADADNTCAGATIANVSLAIGENTKNFRYKTNTAASITLTASDNAAVLSQDTFNLGVGPDRIVITAGPANVKAATCSAQFTVRTRDTAGNNASVLANTQVNLADGSATGTFHELADCSDGPVTSIAIANGASTGTFYFKDTTGAALTITASDNAASLASGTHNITVGPDRLIIAGDTAPKSGVCTAYTVTAQDAAGNARSVGGANVQVDLTDGAANGEFYAAADNTCAGATVTFVTIAAASSSQTFHYRNNTAQGATLQAADNAGNLSTDTHAITTGPDRLAVTGTTPIKAGTCHTYTVTSKDTAGNTANVGANVTVNIDDNAAAGTLYASTDGSCSGGATATVTILSGSSSAQFDYIDNTAQSVTIDADDNAASLASGSLNVSVGPDRLIITGTTPVMAGTCTLLTITSRDAQPADANVGANTQVDLDDGGANGEFYAAADNTCSGATIANRTITSGTGSVQFRYKNNTGQTAAITGDDPSANNLTTASYNLQTGPSRLVATGSSPASPMEANTCTTVTVRSRDEAGNNVNATANITVNLSDNTATGVFYNSSDGSCSGGSPASVTLANGSSTVSFDYMNTNGETATIDVDDNAGNLASGSINITTGPDRLLVTAASTSYKAGTCQLFTVKSQDGGGNDVNTTAAVTVNLGDGGAAGDFYAAADNTCSGAVIGDVSIANGANTTTFRYKTDTAASVTITVSDAAAGGLTSDTENITVGPDRLELTGPASISTIDCEVFTVTAKDAAGNAANPLAAVTVNLAETGSGSFYDAADATCSGATIATRTIPTTGNNVTFRYKDAVSENVTIQASDNAAGGLTASNTISYSPVINCSPDNLLVELPGGTSVTAGTGFDIRITYRAGVAPIACINGNRVVTWSMNGATAGTLGCGETNGSPEIPGGAAATGTSTVSFTNGVGTTTSTDAMFKVVAANATIDATIGTLTGNSGNITVGAAGACSLVLRSAANGGGAEVTTSNIDMYLSSATALATTSVTVYANSADRYGNALGDVTATWSGTGAVYPVVKTNGTNANDSATVYGVKVGTGTLSATVAGVTKNVNVTVSNTNGIGTISTATNDNSSPASAQLGSNTVLSVDYWNPTADAVTAWRTDSTQPWYSEAFAANSRGSQKAFPYRAALVGHASGFDILDASNNHLWMRFTQSAANTAIDSNCGDVYGATGLNGKIYVTMRDALSSPTTGCLIVLDFTNNTVTKYNTAGKHVFNGLISASGVITGRNTANTWTTTATPVLPANPTYRPAARRLAGV
ncbi:MAG TPA: hypothetical protein VFV50_14000, partial [Bdellovibrionales bacterium]|nr:hypothetical protein [Bdellovibrionales bacterium]